MAVSYREGEGRLVHFHINVQHYGQIIGGTFYFLATREWSEIMHSQYLSDLVDPVYNTCCYI